jgi:hypothetical protein
MNKREYWYCQECSEMERPCILTTDEQPFSDGDGPGCCPFDNSGAGVPSRWMRRSPKMMHPRQAYRIERKCIGLKDAPAQRMEPAPEPEPITTGSTSTVQGCDAKGAIVICPSCRNQFEVTHIYK